MGACPHRQFHTWADLLQSGCTATLKLACHAGRNLYHFYGDLTYDLGVTQTHDLQHKRQTCQPLSHPDVAWTYDFCIRGRHANHSAIVTRLGHEPTTFLMRSGHANHSAMATQSLTWEHLTHIHMIQAPCDYQRCHSASLSGNSQISTPIFRLITWGGRQVHVPLFITLSNR